MGGVISVLRIFSKRATMTTLPEDFPNGLMCLLTHSHGHGTETTTSNRSKRKFIYKILFQTMKEAGVKGKLIFPNEIVHLIRTTWPDHEMGKYDPQHSAAGVIITIKQLLDIE